ncbi:MAG TPA: hypothetical protein VFA98_01275 [Thermoanaerobaculia bacterium]|nr:hypothetical protein [Thermoanaerobaculia bacterium]
MIPLRGAAEIASRLELAAADTILLVEPPAELEAVVTGALADGQALRSVEGRAIRTVKDRFALVLVWQESRIGSQAVLATALKRLAPGGFLWVASALRKVSGPKTPAVHRLDLADLEKAFGRSGLVRDREVRLSAWHVAYRFAAKPMSGGA